MQFSLNGEWINVTANDRSLLHFLREQHGLTGTKNGCELGQCGACRVLVDDVSQPSCQLPLDALAGTTVLTIEGVSAGPKLHPVQNALIAEQAVQCGFCLPGIVISAVGLLAANPDPSEADIRTALDINLCRCGVHNRVVRAIQRARKKPLSTAVPVQQGSKAVLAPESISQPDIVKQNRRADSWLSFAINGEVNIFPGKMELGQGIHSALSQIVAAELAIDPSMVKVAQPDTQHSLNEGYTSGSRSMETTGTGIRIAAAAVRAFCTNYALEEFEAIPADLELIDGHFQHRSSERGLSYWEIMRAAGRDLDIPESVKTYSDGQSALSLHAVPRPDLRAKVTGEMVYIQDLVLPEMVYGHLLRPPTPEFELVEFPEFLSDLPGVLYVHRDGQLLGLIAASAADLRSATRVLAEGVRWQRKPIPVAKQSLFEQLSRAPAQSFLLEGGRPVEGPLPEPSHPHDASQRIQARFEKPFQLRATLGPSAGIAQFNRGQLDIWTYNQGVFPLKSGAAAVTNLDETNIRVRRMEGSGCYGHNGADDAAMDAVVLAMAYPGPPVHVQWTRADENAWEPTAPAMAMQFEASLDSAGALLSWDQEVWSYPHLGRPRGRSDGFSNYLAANQRADGLPRPERQVIPAPHLGGWRNAEPLYELPSLRNITHFVPDSPMRTSSFRGLGAFGNIFAIESFMDEMAIAASRDPLEFRLAYHKDSRARDVLKAAADAANWRDRADVAPNRGRGLAFARYKNQAIYLAAVVEVEVQQDPLDIRLIDVVIAADAGQIVDPDGIANQLEGGFIQAASMALYEQVGYSPQGIHTLDWESYPILRFGNSPTIRTVLIDRPNQPFLGTGEGATGPAPAAIANAVAQAGGPRLRRIPFLR